MDAGERTSELRSRLNRVSIPFSTIVWPFYIPTSTWDSVVDAAKL